MSGLIYKVTSPVGKCYIGKTTQTFETRKQRHYKRAFEKDSNGKFVLNTKFANAVRKYENDLKWQILEQNIPKNRLNDLEKFYIKQTDSFESGYNSTEGGDGGNTYATL